MRHVTIDGQMLESGRHEPEDFQAELEVDDSEVDEQYVVRFISCTECGVKVMVALAV